MIIANCYNRNESDDEDFLLNIYFICYHVEYIRLNFNFVGIRTVFNTVITIVAENY